MSISDHHEQEILLPRGITAAQAEGYGVRSIETEKDLPEEFRNSRYATVPGLLFPWHSPLAGTVWQYRPDSPVTNDHGDPVKYTFHAGQQMVLGKLRDSGDGPVLLAEGTMQSLAAAIHSHDGWNVYGLSGCWSWRQGSTQVAIPDLLVCEGRDVVIGLDADAATNHAVYSAGLALQDALEAEGAHSVRFLRLDGHGSKAGLDDVLGARPADKRTGYLMRLLERAEEKPAAQKPPKRSGGGVGRTATVVDPTRPTIMVNDDRREVINQMTDALRSRWDGDRLFGYGGIIAQRTDAAAVRPVTEGVFADLISEAAQCVTINAKGDMSHGWPDEKSCKAVLARSDRFALLEKISRVPFVRPDGTICQQPGYDEASATYLALDETVSAVEVPDEPSEDDVRSAVKLLTGEWLGDLFDAMPEPEDRANCLALMLTPLIRGMVPLAPMAVIDGLQPGVGKNLIADLLSIFATGKPAAPLPYSRDDDENRKVITSSFRQGLELLVFDEAHTIEGRHLARTITGITYSDRILGVSNMIEFPNRVTWVALGNNVVVNGDLSRRVYRIRLAPKTANPQDRDISSYRHPDIKGWTTQHRADLIGAALTLVRAWFTSEKAESAAGRRFGSFEAWGGMIGGILDHAGIEGFLGSLVQWRSETDYETSFWSDHLRWLLTVFGNGAEFTVPEVIKKMKQAPQGSVEHPPRLEDHSVVGYNRALGLAYGRMKTRTMNGLQLVKVAAFAGHSNKWSVIDTTAPVADSDEPSTEESDTQEERVDRVDRVVTKPATCREISSYTSCVTHKSDFSGSAEIPIYPMYPYYPSTEGADPLAHLLDHCVEVAPRVCPDCEQPEELTPSGLWAACPRCTPQSFQR